MVVASSLHSLPTLLLLRGIRFASMAPDAKDKNITFLPGDSVAIIPENDPRLIEEILKELNTKKDEIIIDPKTKEKITVYDFLLKKATITKLSPSLIKMMFENLDFEEIKKIQMNNHLIDLLKDKNSKKPLLQNFIDNLLPLLPRLYSISSSQRIYPNEIHLIVTHVTFKMHDTIRKGVATEYICHLAKIAKTPIKIYIQPTSSFNLPEDSDIPIIMIAVGCGIAPFRAFLEERYFKQANGMNWLFFGERCSKTDFYFENFFNFLEDKNFLRKSTAFSRDQEEKIYVQNRVIENGADIWQWIHDKAIIYICGSIQLGYDVDKAFLQIFEQEGGLNEPEAKSLLKTLIKDKRYLKDVY